jgi:hypothetical protein
MKYILNSTGFVFFHRGKPVKIEKNSAQYARIHKVFDLPESQQEQAVEDILNENFDSFNKDGFVINGDSVSYKGETLPSVLADKIRSIVKEGLPVKLFVKFWENLQNNPSASSVRELYDFLAYKELPITEDGCFLAYKGLQGDYWSISGNLNTKVVKGIVDKSGRIFNGVGERIEVRRFDVDDNRHQHCSFGLHVGSLNYASDFSQGKVVVVKVNPKDVVSVPTDYNCQKCRVSAYQVVEDFTREIVAPVTNSEAVEIVSQDKQEYCAFTARIQAYLEKKYDQGLECVSVKSIQNSFSPDYPARVRVLDAVSELGYVWTKDEEGHCVVIL